MNIIKGKLYRPQKIVVYGPEGIGKTTFASSFPSPVFIDTEGGTGHLEVDRFQRPSSWTHVTKIVKELTEEKHDYKTLVIDTADWLERLLIDHVCKNNNKQGIEDFGYGKGYTYVSEELNRFLVKLDKLIELGINLVMTAHCSIRKFELPEQTGSFDRYELKLSKSCAPLVKEWCDMLLFANYYTKLAEVDGKKKALGGKERKLYSERCATFDAKNRHGLAETMPMEFSSISHLFEINSEGNKYTDEIKGMINQYSTIFTEEKLKKWKLNNINSLNIDQSKKALSFIKKKIEESYTQQTEIEE